MALGFSKMLPLPCVLGVSSVRLYGQLSVFTLLHIWAYLSRPLVRANEGASISISEADCIYNLLQPITMSIFLTRESYENTHGVNPSTEKKHDILVVF